MKFNIKQLLLLVAALAVVSAIAGSLLRLEGGRACAWGFADAWCLRADPTGYAEGFYPPINILQNGAFEQRDAVSHLRSCYAVGVLFAILSMIIAAIFAIAFFCGLWEILGEDAMAEDEEKTDL